MIDRNKKPVLLTVQEARELLRVRRAKIYELLEADTLQGTKVGNSWRITVESVERLVGTIPEHFFVEDEPTAAISVESAESASSDTQAVSSVSTGTATAGIYSLPTSPPHNR